MKVAKLLKNFDARIDKLYDELYKVRDAFSDIEDEEIDFIVEGFIEQVELSISEGATNTTDVRDRIGELLEEE